MKKQINILLCITTMMLLSCTFGEQYDANFDLAMDGGNTVLPPGFVVSSVQVTDLTDIPDNCFLMGQPVREMAGPLNEDLMGEDQGSTPDGIRRSSSTTASSIIQNLFNYGQRNRVIEVVGTYASYDTEGKPVRLSGKVVLPSDGKAKGIIFVSHYTIGSNAEAPSNAFPLEATLAQLGYVMIFPDYLGYGITADRVHPYLVLEQTMQDEMLMLMGVLNWLNTTNIEFECKPENNIMLMGYSQGGANTMALLYYLESNTSFILHRAFAGGGPYDVLATYDRFVVSDTTGYPVAVPLVMQGMIEGNHLDLNMADLMQPYVYDNLDNWINQKRLTTAQVNEQINTHVTHEILSAKGMDRESKEVSELYKAMTENSILSYSWTPKTSVYMFHSMDDETVTFVNATRARAKWSNGNIQYNFGHYGSHVSGCLRFIYSVQTLLKEEADTDVSKWNY